MFLPFPLLNKVIQKLCAIQEPEVILIAPWWPTQPWFSHLLTSTLCGSFSVLSIPSRPAVTTGTEIHLRRKVLQSVFMEALMEHYKATGFSDEVSRLAHHLGDPQPISSMSIGGFASFTAPQGKDLIHLVPCTAAQIAAFLYLFGLSA